MLRVWPYCGLITSNTKEKTKHRKINELESLYRITEYIIGFKEFDLTWNPLEHWRAKNAHGPVMILSSHEVATAHMPKEKKLK